MNTKRYLGILLLSVLAVGGAACDDSLGPEDEVHGTILSKDLVLSTITLTNNSVYMINGETEFEDGLLGLHDDRLRPGVQIEIDYFHDEGLHIASEIEMDGIDD